MTPSAFLSAWNNFEESINTGLESRCKRSKFTDGLSPAASWKPKNHITSVPRLFRVLFRVPAFWLSHAQLPFVSTGQSNCRTLKSAFWFVYAIPQLLCIALVSLACLVSVSCMQSTSKSSMATATCMEQVRVSSDSILVTSCFLTGLSDGQQNHVWLLLCFTITGFESLKCANALYTKMFSKISMQNTKWRGMFISIV